MADDFADSEKGNSLGIAESRAHSRTPMRSLAYIELSDGNGGLILNISEDGIAVQAVQVVSAEQLSHMRFRLPKTSMPIEVMGRLVWQLRSKKEAGIQFVNLSDEARQGIRDWIGADASRPIAEPDARQNRPLKAEMPLPVTEPPKGHAPPAQPPEAQAAAPATPKQQPVKPAAAAPSRGTSAVAVPPKTKPKETRPPAPEPPIASPRIPMPPAPAPPATAAQQSASTIFVQQQTILPASGPTPAPAPGKPPSAGSAFPAGQLPFRPGARTDVPMAQAPLHGTVPNMPSWGGYVAPGVGMRYRKPRGWWTYTAALGIIAAVGFAGLMMIDPSTISRARLATVEHQPNPNATVPQAFAANNNNPSVPPTTNSSPSIPGANGSGAATPSVKTRQQTSPNQSNANGANGSPTEGNGNSDAAVSASNPAIPVNPFDATNSKSASAKNSAAGSRPSNEEASSEESKRPKRDEPAREPARNESAAQPAQSNAVPPEVAQPAKESPASQTQAPLAANSSSGSGNAQPQPTSPTTSSTSVPASTPPVQSVGAQPSANQRDQDDYARTAKREGVNGTANANHTPAQETSPTHTTTATEAPRPSVEVPGERSSPVAPSVPLVGVPSGSVGANSQFRSFRIPPELQSKAARLASNLQIGQMLSSYAPSYPVDAARAGVEGIVKLDVMVAPNGNVETVKVISGPPALTAVSISAVKGWHYGETLLGGQPVEAEQYVTLIFRLAK